METNKELTQEQPIEFEELLNYSDEQAYEKLFQEFLKVPYENFVKRTDDEIRQLMNKDNILELIEIVAELGEIHHIPMIRISKAVAGIVLTADNPIINDSQAKAVARYFYEDKKRRTNSKINMIFKDRDEDEEESNLNFGEFVVGYDEDDKEIEEIYVYIENILDTTLTREEAIFELLNTINHEFYHAIESKKRTRENIYDHYTLQAALDATIYNSPSLKYHGKDYYAVNYNDIVEEQRAEIYGMSRTLDILKQYSTNQYDHYVKKAERKIVQLEMQKSVNMNFQGELAKSRFEVANQMVDKLIKEEPEIIDGDKILRHAYNGDGTRKKIMDLIFDKARAQNAGDEKLAELEELVQKNKKRYEKKYRETAYNSNKINQYYAELINYAFKTVDYEEFKELYNHGEETVQQLETSLYMVLKNREAKLVENNSMYLHSLLKLKTWKRQLENLKRHVDKSKRAIQKFNNLNERALRDDELAKTR